MCIPHGTCTGISLRAIDPDRFCIVDETTGNVVEEIEDSKAFWEVYDGAVYLFQVGPAPTIWLLRCVSFFVLVTCHQSLIMSINSIFTCSTSLSLQQGRTYLCKQLDLGSKVAVVRPADVKYYTKTVDFVDVLVTGGNVAFPAEASAFLVYTLCCLCLAFCPAITDNINTQLNRWSRVGGCPRVPPAARQWSRPAFSAFIACGRGLGRCLTLWTSTFQMCLLKPRYVEMVTCLYAVIDPFLFLVAMLLPRSSL